MVLSGVDHWTLTDGSKHSSGYWAEEFAVPHRILTDAGFNVDIAAPVGGKPTSDPVSLKPEVAGPEAAEFAAYIDLDVSSRALTGVILGRGVSLTG